MSSQEKDTTTDSVEFELEKQVNTMTLNIIRLESMILGGGGCVLGYNKVRIRSTTGGHMS